MSGGSVGSSGSSSSGSSEDGDGQPRLPKGWVKAFSNSQQRWYYSHKETKHTQWHYPTATEAKDPWMAQKRAQDNVNKEKQRADAAKKRKADPAGDTNSKRPKEDDAAAPASVPKPVVAKPPSDHNQPNVAIIVPYRDLHVEQHRAQHLSQFGPHMLSFLQKALGSTTNFHIYIIEQNDDQRKFNRGKLLNIGFDYATKTMAHRQHNVVCLHDVDLLPQPDLAYAYATPPAQLSTKGPLHIARVWDRYSNNPNYFGGVVSFSLDTFRKINGYPNTFWGWGGEDDALQVRCQAVDVTWAGPTQGGTLRDLEAMDLKTKMDFLKEHAEWKCMVKWEAMEEQKTKWQSDGLSDLQYRVLSTQALDNKPQEQSMATKVTVDVQLNGTHWANDKSGVDFKADWVKK